jgi:hypothetical protein
MLGTQNQVTHNESDLLKQRVYLNRNLKLYEQRQKVIREAIHVPPNPKQKYKLFERSNLQASPETLNLLQEKKANQFKMELARQVEENYRRKMEEERYVEELDELQDKKI